MEITKQQFDIWVRLALACELAKETMITAKGVVSKKEMSRLKAMGFIVSSKAPEGNVFKVTLVRTVSVWPGLIDRLGAEFPGLTFEEGK